MNESLIDTENNAIVCGKTFMKNASRYGTPEYNAFVGMKRDFPSYKVVVVEPKKAEAKMSTKGLTREFMEIHIATIFGTDSAEYMAFTNQMELSNAYRNPYMYMRRWFVKAYPDWDGKEVKRQEIRARKAAAKAMLVNESIDNDEKAAA